MGHYTLGSGGAAEARLRTLADVHEPGTRALLDRLDVARGARCLDVGCGIGAVTCMLAERAGAGGEALGIDLDEASIATARREAEARGLSARFAVRSADDLPAERGFDLVYARCLLSHLPTRARVLSRMVDAARPGGLVVVEDIDMGGAFASPPCPAFERYVQLYQDVVGRRGGDATFGRELLRAALAAGLHAASIDVVLPAFERGPKKALATMTFDHLRPALLHEGLATSVELDAIGDELRAFVSDETTVLSMPRVFQVWGRTPAPR